MIHYAPVPGGNPVVGTIHKADFSEFIKTDARYEILHFPDDGSDPVHESVILTDCGGGLRHDTSDLFTFLRATLRRIKGYRVYSAHETVERAKSRVGEDEYSLIFNNCEHFALWCKTGLRESSQVDDFWKSFWINQFSRIGDSQKYINPLLM